VNVEGCEVFGDVLPIHFDGKQRVAATAGAHGRAFQGDAFRLDGFHKLHEGLGSDHTQALLQPAGIHLAQPAAEGLLREDVAFGGVGAKPNDGGDVQEASDTKTDPSYKRQASRLSHRKVTKGLNSAHRLSS